MIVVTTNDLPGYRIVQLIGLVKGITVRSRSVIGNIGGSLQALFGGNLSVYTSLAESGANAIIAMRYEANEIMDGITEVLAYGTAVVVEKQ
jgi:uncharacterized protein YbjQ (UPF0145 family)